MSPADVAAIVKLRLAVELEDDRVVLVRLLNAVGSLRQPAADPRDDWMRALALAFAVERFYTATEAMLTRILRTVDGEVPRGDAWHLDVLRAASAAIPGGRPALVTPDTAKELRELLKFRHLARHGYGDEPEPVLMDEHAGRVIRAHSGFVTSLDALDRWLRDSR